MNQAIIPEYAFALAVKRQHAAKLLGVSPPHFDKLVKAEIVPKPLDLAGVNVWRVEELRDCLAKLRSGGTGWGAI